MKGSVRLALLPLVGILLISKTGSAQDVEQATPYSGPPLKGSVFLCKSDHVTGAGFRRDIEKGSMLRVIEADAPEECDHLARQPSAQ
jgi:hypothetical protein